MTASISMVLARMGRGLRKLASDPREWFVLVGDRLVVAGLLTVLFGIVVAAIVRRGVVNVRQSGDLLYAFQVLVGANVTLVTIVLSINQLVLSREFRTPGELRQEIENVISYRDEVGATMDRNPVPVTPHDFLHTIIDGTHENAEQLAETVDGVDEELDAEVTALVSELTSNLSHIDDVLNRSKGGVFSALVVTLETNYSKQLNELRLLRREYGDALPRTTNDAFDELIESLKTVDIGRQYLRSVYIQSELAQLSRILLYVGVPAVASALVMLLVFAGAPRSPTLSPALPVLVTVVMALGFAPLAVLFSFILRVAVVAQRTVAITPFTTPTQESEI